MKEKRKEREKTKERIDDFYKNETKQLVRESWSFL